MHNIADEFSAGERFNEPEVVQAVKELVNSVDLSSDDALVGVSAEWQRKGYATYGPLDTENSYRKYGDTALVVTVQLRFEAWESASDSVETVRSAAQAALAERANQVKLEKERARQAKIVELEAELARLKAE